MILSDGSVISSALSALPIGETSTAMGTTSNLALRRGEVKEIIYPDDPKSSSKKYTEYRVAVQQNDGMETGSIVEYSNCQVMSLFGGVTDKLVYTLRADSQTTTEKGTGIGSKVHVLCEDGNSNRAFIIGGLRDSNESSAKDSGDAGHNLLFEFNGIRALINKDGEFEINFNGATDNTGKLLDGVDSANSGSVFHFLKNGDIQLGHDDQVLTLEHESQAWRMKAAKAISEETDGDWSGVAQKTAFLAGKQSLDLQTEGAAVITAKETKIGSDQASEHLVLGDTYRSAESQMMKSLSTSLNTLATAITTLTGAVQTAGGFLKIPITGGILASPSFAAMNMQLQLIGQTLSTMYSDIETFEGSASNYLSGNNTTE
jgi:hypothetical protein